ncbi:MAG: ATP-binding cassette domain-containing protein, partial [Actinobacteria bacterium]|nr:ATP-binding cassette domain-containing protein [Actinomycetota bacterium]
LLRDINLSIADGETRMLFGENGSGKTSLLMAIMGLGPYKTESGRILFKGEDITRLPANERASRGIGIMFQRPPTIRGLKVKQMLEIIERDGQDLEKLADSLNFREFLDRDLNLGFSGGEIKRAELLQLLAQDPDLALLDEPESGVDLVNISLIGNAIGTLLQKDLHRTRKKAGLIISHSGYILDYVEADRGCVLVNNTIWCTGNPHEILQGIRERGYEGCLTCQR